MREGTTLPRALTVGDGGGTNTGNGRGKEKETESGNETNGNVQVEKRMDGKSGLVCPDPGLRRDAGPG